jgi:peptidyl-prolyl cis-trans isomerase C
MALLHRLIALFLLCGLLLSACGQVVPTDGTKTPAPSVTPWPSASPPGPTLTAPPPTATPSPVPPSPTPAPLAARVNGAGITQAAYDAELQRLQAGLKETGKSMSADEQRQTVLQNLIDQLLLAQGAAQSGYALSEADFQIRLAALIARSGGAPAFADWLARNFYTSDSFQQALRLDLAAAWQRDQVIAKAPTSAEQVHARQILVLNEDLANRLYIQLQAGSPFQTLAIQMDPESGGELGWFPRNYLFLPEIETAAFNLQPGKYSAIIKTSYGYHIVFVAERDSTRPLAPDARLQAQRDFLRTWLTDRRAQSQIEILLK